MSTFLGVRQIGVSSSCRNLLIYLDKFLQKKTLSTLHYSLKPKGFLVLGTAESVMTMSSFYTAIDNRQKIYSKNDFSKKTIIKKRRPITLIKPLQTPSLVKPVILISKKMEKLKLDASKVVGSKKKISGKSDQDIKTLKKEFARTEKRLIAISEEKDSFNEELRAANEEIQSSNEELQSMNEELETSKEELQSTNEELLSVNDEMQNKNEELTHLNSDLNNFFSSTNIPIIIVTSDLRIKSFTPMARKVMNLIPTDINRPISDIKLNIDINNLEDLILTVIEDIEPKELEVRDKDGQWYSMRIRPYRTVDNKIEGATISLIDIDTIKRSREEVQGTLNYAQAIIDTMREPLFVLNSDLRIISTNKSFCDTFKVKVSDIKNKLIYELDGYMWNSPKLRKLLEEILPKKNFFNDFELSFNFSESEQRTMILNGRQIKLHRDEGPLILLVMEDITDRKKAENILMRDNKTLDTMIKKRSRALTHLQTELIKTRHLSAVGTLAATVAHELRNPLADIAISIHRIKKKIDDDPYIKEILNNINVRVLECNQTITDILMYSKSTIVRYESVKFNDIIRSSIDEEVRNFPIGKVLIKEQIDQTKDTVIDADFIRIKEVIRNVLRNAVEAVNADTGIIEITSEVKNLTVSIIIKDNGVGIGKNDLKKITNPFFTTKVKGTGLGLASCKQVLMLHSGSINIKSIQGKGAMVTITLPIKKAENA